MALPPIPQNGLIYSPCSNVCAMDQQSGWCKGCYRSLSEIARWGQMTDAQKMGVWQQLAGREAQAVAVINRANPALIEPTGL